MSQIPLGNVLYTATKGLLVAMIKFSFVIISFGLKLAALITTKLSEAIDKIINKRL